TNQKGVGWGQFLLKALVFLMLLTASMQLRAQEVAMDWAKAFLPNATAGGAVVPYGVGTDANGNVYVSGYFTGTVDFNPGPAVTNLTASVSSAFFVKLDKEGNFIWAKQVGSTGGTTSYALKVDAAGNIYAGGTFAGTGDFNPNAGVNNLVSNGTLRDGYILKLDTNGNYVWAQRMGGPNNEYSHDIDLDAAGNVYVIGHIGAGTATFGALSITSAGGTDAFVTKLSPAGAYQWVRRLGGPGEDATGAVDVDAAGNVYISGGAAGNATGMATLAGAGGFMIKLNTNGTTLWSNLSTETTNYRGIAIDSDGNVYGGGGGTATVVKLNSSGTRVWSRKVGTSSYKLKVGPDNNIYSGGIYNGTSTTMGSFTLPFNGGAYDMYVAGLNPAGDVLWAKPFGASGVEGPFYLSADVPGEVLTAGFFNETVDFDPGPCVFNLTDTSPTGNSGFVLKLTSNALPAGFAVSPSTVAPLTQTACSLGIPNVITGNAVGVTAPAGYTTTIVYQWQKSTSASGPWEDMAGEVFKDLQPLASSESLYYRRLIKAGTNFCGVFQTMDTSAVATVTVGANTAP
ncbi:hypothetical protein, partial [Dyadobacter crusticola]|uniref:hypothetical protein n=1 Tax=Dyadobacter crusticola TaxID=292407 RepID=UPI0004E2813B